MFVNLLVALGLVFVLEGILPFLNPRGMRRMMTTMANLDDRTLRVAGMVSMIVGLMLLYVIRWVG